jgi:hypothetical protein
MRPFAKTGYAALLLALFAWIPLANAGGSVALNDLLKSSATRQPSAQFTQSVQLGLDQAKVTATDVICSANRLGRQWTNLGGERIGPYQCKIGDRTLEITATPTFLDKNGNVLQLKEPALVKKATSLKEQDFVGSFKN